MKLSPDNNYAWGQGAMDFNEPLTKLKALSLYRKDSLPSEKEAALYVVKTGIAATHEAHIRALLKLHPNSTSKELERLSKGTKHEITHAQIGKRTGKAMPDVCFGEVRRDRCCEMYLRGEG